MKLYFTLFCSLVLTFSSYAQFGYSKLKDDRIKLEISQSFNYFSLNGDQSIVLDNKPSLGFTFGVGFDISINRNTSAKFGVFYMNNKTKNTEFYTDQFYGLPARDKITNTFKYIHFPVLLKYKFDNHIFINGGAFLSQLSEIKRKSGISTNSIPKNLQTERLDYGIIAGLGYSFLVDDSNEMFFELRQTMGLGNNGLDTFASYNTSSTGIIMGWTFYL